MSVSKKSIIVSLFACLVLFLGLAFGFIDTNRKTVRAVEDTGVGHYFYNQLTDEQKEFYKATEQMNVQGIFKKDADYDPVTNGHVTQAQLDVSYGALETSQGVIQVDFVAESVKMAEESREETADIPQLQAADISVETSFSLKVGETLEIKAEVTAYGDTNEYQWYKDDVALEGQTSDTLLIENVQESDAGQYFLKVTSSKDTDTVVSDSELIQVSITAASGPDNSKLALTAKIILLAGGGLIAVAFVAIIIVAIVRKSASKRKE